MDEDAAAPEGAGRTRLRADVTAEAVAALRSAAESLPLGRPGQPGAWAADWLRRRADLFEAALTDAARSGETTPVAEG